MKWLARAVWIVALPLLTGCAGYETGNGLSRLDTTTPEQQENDAWFKSFYGNSHCVWGSNCGAGEASAGGGGGGGAWTGGVGPTDGGGSSGSSDSGSSN